MGRCSATEIFDPMVKYILGAQFADDSGVNRFRKYHLIRKLIDVLEEYDWDCQSDSEYYDHPIVHQAMKSLHPDWFTEETT